MGVTYFEIHKRLYNYKSMHSPTQMWPFGGGNPFDSVWTEEAPPTPETFFPREPATLDHITSISSLSKVLNCFEKESHGAVELQRKAYDLFQEDEVYFTCIYRCLNV
jgi:hypothetical protein